MLQLVPNQQRQIAAASCRQCHSTACTRNYSSAVQKKRKVQTMTGYNVINAKLGTIAFVLEYLPNFSKEKSLFVAGLKTNSKG